MTEATARETKSQGDKVAQHPRLLNWGGPTGRRSHDLDQETPRKPPQVEVPIPTGRKTSPHCESKNPQAETWGAEIENQNVSPSQCFPKSEGRHHRWNGEWPKKWRKGMTVKPVPTTRNGKEPVYSHNLQGNSQARFCQLDTTVARRNRQMKSRRGLRQTPRGRGRRRPAQARQNHHAKLSLEEARIDRKEIPVDAQGIKGTRVAAARHSQRRGRQATTHTRAWPIRSRGKPQSPAQRPERERSPTEAGRNTLRCLQLRSDQQWEEETPLELLRKIPRKDDRISVARAQSEQGTNRGPQVAKTRNTAPHADEQRTTRSSGKHALSRPPAG